MNSSVSIRAYLPHTALVLALFLVLLDAQQASRWYRLRVERQSLEEQERQRLESEKLVQESKKSLTQRVLQMSAYEKTIPEADGYIFVSKLLRESGPNSSLTIDPPEIGGHELLDIPEYCTAIFRVRGTGSVEELQAILKQVETRVPFSRTQELQLIFSDEDKTKVNFSFSLLLVLRLNDNSEAFIKTAL